MLDFYLSVNNSEEVVHIPVTPPSFSVTNSQSTETFESAGYGWIKIIGNTELRGVSWDGIFPVHDYPFRRDASMDGQEYYEKLKSWQKRKLPVRLVITSTGFANISINMAVAIEKLDFDVGTTGDLDYSIELGEVELLNDTEDTNMAQLDDLAARMDAVEKRLDSLENEKIYNYMDDNMPDWAKPTIQKLMDRGYLNGTGDNELGLTMDIVRMCVMIDNANGFEGYTVDSFPDWAAPTIEKISKKGYLSGIDDDDLGLTKNMIRILVILDKAGVFGD